MTATISAAPTAAAPADPRRERRSAVRANAGLYLGVAALALVVGAVASRQPLYAAALVVALGGLAAMVQNPTLGVYLLPVVPVLSGLGRGVPVPGFRLSELLTMWVGVTLLVRGRMEAGSRAPRWRAFDWLAFLYSSAAVAIPLFDVYVDGQPAGPSKLQVLGPLQYFVLFRAAVICLDTPARQRSALRILLGSSCITNVFAILQSLNVPGVRSLIDTLIGLNPYATAGYVSVPRATGLFSHWHVLAGYDTAIVLIMTALLLGHCRVLSLRSSVLVGALAVGGIAASVTTTTAFGVVIGAVVIGLTSKRLGQVLFWIVATGVGVGAAIWPLITARVQAQSSSTDVGTGSAPLGGLLPQTVAYRWQIWTEQYVPAIGKRLLTGYGPQLPSSITWPYPENVYLSLLVDGGVLLLVAFLAWMAALIGLSFRAIQRRPPEGRPDLAHAVAQALFALLVALVVMQMLFPYLLTNGLPGLVWLLAAVVVRNRDPVPRPRSRPQPLLAHNTRHDGVPR